jgi:hypothetical protein
LRAIRLWYSAMFYRERAIARLPRRTLNEQVFGELAQQPASRNSGPQLAKAPGALSEPSNEGIRTPEPNLGGLIYLISLGIGASEGMMDRG